MPGTLTTAVRVLVADDEPVILDLYRQILAPSSQARETTAELEGLGEELFGGQAAKARSLTFEMTTCRQGDAAVEAARAACQEGRPFGVAFLDVRMPPGPDGVWTAEQLRRLDPGLQIVISTAFSDVDPLDIVRRVPPADKLLYIQKPFAPYEIRQLAHSLASKWLLETQLRQTYDQLEARVASRTAALTEANQKLQQEIEERQRADERLRQHARLLRAQNLELEAQRQQLQAQQEELKAANRALADAQSQAEAATVAKSEFLANMSHEIRTPMTAILGFTDILLEHGNLEEAPPTRIEAAKTIKRNGEHLLNLINDILDLSKIEGGKMTTERVGCSPCQLVAEVASIMRVRADAKGLALEIEFEGSIPETIQTDPTRLRQILINLVGNAIKFTEVGRVRLITRLADGDGQARMEFDVADTGLGMTSQEVARLFRPFTQADASTTRRFGGTGLGLTICSGLAALLGGKVFVVETAPGLGTRFRATIDPGPLGSVARLTDPTGATVVTRPAERTMPSRAPLDLHGRRLLLVEDGPDNQRLIAHLLRKAGATVEIAENGQLGVEAALEARDAGDPFDVILMDMQMPVMDGYQATAALRQAGYSGLIIALTAHAMSGAREQCLQAGCDDYATKPIDVNRLAQVLQRKRGRESFVPSTR